MSSPVDPEEYSFVAYGDPFSDDEDGFKPKSFHSSRKNRQRDLDEKFAQHPEDFMDDEDFGEFGIAPRRIRPTHEFDDTHVRDTLQLALGDQSVIPQAGSLLKGLIVATR
ncbi:unnamed protein product [Schistosoma margrebowiei]|uniref:Uncharacterized protein n=1 Tax=Schistosoma margrebowiei TaxID=48269 RepID=A0A183MR14_9TREM|nr:unnamed protein product [Schistosoma margrebowiei]